MKRAFLSLIALGLVLLFPTVAEARPGDLDRSFGKGGIAVVPSVGKSSRALDVAVGNDDQVVVAGQDGNGPLLAGLTRKGRPDMRFGDSGLTPTVPWECGNCVQPVLSAIKQGPGFLVSGVSNGDGMVARLDADGQIDENWASGSGYAGSFGVVWDIARTPGGKIMVVTSEQIVRLQPTGEIDETFGTLGTVDLGDLPAGGRRLSAYRIDVSNSGFIYVAGSAYRGGRTQQVFVTKLRKTGEFDDSFGEGSAVIFPRLGYSTDINASSEGLYVAATLMSRRGETSTNRAALLKFSLSGKPSRKFGKGGLVKSRSDRSFSSSVIVTQQHVIAQTALTPEKRGGRPPLRISRLNHRGRLDRSFGDGGRTKIRGISPGGMALDSKSRILIAGFRGKSNRGKAVVARLKGGMTRVPLT